MSLLQKKTKKKKEEPQDNLKYPSSKYRTVDDAVMHSSKMSYLILSLQIKVQPDAHKQIYILKRTSVPVSAENYRDLLLFGFLSSSPLVQLSTTVKQVNLALVLHVVIYWFCIKVP